MKAALSQVANSCVYDNSRPKKMQYTSVIIPHMLDCWANPVVHLLLLKCPIDYFFFDKSHRQLRRGDRFVVDGTDRLGALPKIELYKSLI